MGEGSSGVAGQGVPGSARVEVGLLAEGPGEAFGDEGFEVGQGLGFGEGCEFLVEVIEGAAGDPVDFKVCGFVCEACRREVSGDVHRRGS